MADLDACAQGCVVILSLPSDGYLKSARDLQTTLILEVVFSYDCSLTAVMR